jgi:hypothetical protein
LTGIFSSAPRIAGRMRFLAASMVDCATFAARPIACSQA